MTTRPNDLERPLDPLITAVYENLSTRMAGGQRRHPDSLLPGADDPLEGILPSDYAPDAGVYDWFDPAVWAMAQEGDITEAMINGLNFPPTSVTSGKGMDFYRGGEAPGNYVNRNNPLYKSRTDFIKSVNPQIERLFGVKGGGVGYYRPPSASDADPGGRSSNSDHYSAGAVDYYGTPDQLDALAAWLQGQPFVSFVRWRSESHTDHLHMSVDLGWVAQNYFQGQQTPTLPTPTTTTTTTAPTPDPTPTPPPVTQGRPS